jgi:nifR3 family TIM-barrel protein
MKNNNLENIKLAMAPMAGFTDRSFREICKNWGADISWSEMVSSEGLVRSMSKENKSLDIAKKFNKNENDYWVQIFGTNPFSMAKAAKIIEEKIQPSGVDINMGCPVKKAKRAGYGAIQMNNISQIIEIIKETKKTIKVPLSLKTRLGITNQDEVLTWAPQLEKAGIDQLVVHARTLRGMFKEEPAWQIVRKLNSLLSIPVIYNGGIKTPEDALFYAQKTSCKTLMIGQAMIGRPWIFKEIKYYLKSKEKISITATEKKDTILSHAKLAKKYFGEKNIISFRVHLLAYLRGSVNAAELRREAIKIQKFEDVEIIVKKIKFK